MEVVAFVKKTPAVILVMCLYQKDPKTIGLLMTISKYQSLSNSYPQAFAQASACKAPLLIIPLQKFIFVLKKTPVQNALAHPIHHVNDKV
jgi:hypothetical protein